MSITVTFLKTSQGDSATGFICPTVTAGQKTISNNDNRALIVIRCVADKGWLEVTALAQFFG
ncbi:MAG TPA: hypothetical protein VFH01_06600, partial [Pyrinomonadaceae bacterium]|nr:hypothetical protein [Pyrinomonadaceae bacterium]